jgi:hypothetical protein
MGIVPYFFNQSLIHRLVSVIGWDESQLMRLLARPNLYSK